LQSEIPYVQNKLNKCENKFHRYGINYRDLKVKQQLKPKINQKIKLYRVQKQVQVRVNDNVLTAASILTMTS